MTTTPAQQKPDRIIKITRKTAKFWRDNLARKSWNPEYPAGETMQEISKTFGIAGTKYEVLIKLVNSDRDLAREVGDGLGEPTGGPYLDAILFADGVEQCVLPPSRVVLEGRYEFRDSVESRDIVVEVKTPDIKKHVITRGDYRTEWWIEGKGRDACVNVDVYKRDRSINRRTIEAAKTNPTEIVWQKTPILKWVYGKIPGNNILGNAAIWLDQAILQAKQNDPDTKEGPGSSRA